MITINQTAQRRAAHFGVSAILLVAGVLLSTKYAAAQYQVTQDGRLFDANTSLSGGRYNYGRPGTPLLGGNPYASGNMSRGLSLRSFSPVGSATDFRATLGSDSLSNFMRDSVSTGDAYTIGGGLTPTAFYDPVRTAPTGRYLNGYYSLQSPTPGQVMPGQGGNFFNTVSQYGNVSQYGAPPAAQPKYDVSSATFSRYMGQPLNTQLNSSIFGVEQPRLPGPLNQSPTPRNASYVPEVARDRFGMPVTESSEQPEVADPLDLRIRPDQRPGQIVTLDQTLRDNTGMMLDPTIGRQNPVGTPTMPPEQFATADGNATQALRDNLVPRPGVELGGDVYTDMRLALELSRNPQAQWFGELLDAAGVTSGTTGQAGSQTEAVERQQQAVEAAAAFITRVFETPLQTFVGDTTSGVNEELRKAELAMDRGQYYNAVRFYERARMFDPANPLPLIGKGHAQLAAGEYVSASFSLITGLTRFDQLAQFRVDLKALMGGGEIVDVRRADLMKQLARKEDPQLRFLLGYLEVHSGIIDQGFENLEQAARESDPGTLIQRYPDLIRHLKLLAPKPVSDTVTSESAVTPVGVAPATDEEK